MGIGMIALLAYRFYTILIQLLEAVIFRLRKITAGSNILPEPAVCVNASPYPRKSIFLFVFFVIQI